MAYGCLGRWQKGLDLAAGDLRQKGTQPGLQEASDTLGCNAQTLRKSFWLWRLLQGAGEMLKPGSLCEATVRGPQTRVLLFQLQVAGLCWRFTSAGIYGSPLTGCGVRLVVVVTAQCLEEPLVRLPRRGLLRVLHLGVLPRAPRWKLPAPPSSLPPRGINYGAQ